MKNKKLLGILGITALLLAGNFAWREAKEVDAAATKTIYLKDEGYLTNKVDWVWSWADNGNGVAYNLTDSDSDGILEVSIPAANNWIIFASGSRLQDWAKQTGNISIPTEFDKPIYTLASDGTGMWSEFGETIPTETYVNTSIGKYLNGGRYVRETKIYIDAENVATDLAENYDGKLYSSLFHAGADVLERITYFDGGELWMTNKAGNINSGYGTNNDGEMNHFKYVNGNKEIDYTVGGSKGMENWYTTLTDIVAKEEHNWEETATGVYKSTSEEVKNWFKDFTAPCYVGFNTGTRNYITFSHAEIQEVSGKLELRLYADGTNDGLILNSDNDEKTPTLFSKATISLPNSNVVIAGSFNNWNANYHLMPTDKSGVYHTEMTLEAGTFEMKVIKNGAWHGNQGTYTVFGDAWDFWGDNDNNCKLTITEKGKYSFEIDINGTYPKLKINKVY